MATLRAIIDTGDTVECPDFTLPTANTLTQKRALVMARESEYIEFVFTGSDTVAWGVRGLVTRGVSQRRDLTA